MDLETLSADDVGRTWRAPAACRGTDRDLFFPIGVTGPAADQIAEAKAVCCACEVRTDCLEFALTTNQEFGTWGGDTEEERLRLRRIRRSQVVRAS